MLRTSVLLLGLAFGASAQMKVAIINSQLAVIETAEIKKAQAELEAKYKPRQSQIETLQKEIAQLQQQLQAGQGKLAPQAEQDIQVRGQRKQRELTRLGEDLQAEVVAVGSGRLLESGGRGEMDVKPGDRILFGKYGGSEVKIGGEQYLILREDEILAVLG